MKNLISPPESIPKSAGQASRGIIDPADGLMLQREFRRPALLAMLLFYAALILVFVWMAGSEKQASVEREGRLARAALAESKREMLVTARGLRLAGRWSEGKPEAELHRLHAALRTTEPGMPLLLVYPSGDKAGAVGEFVDLPWRDVIRELQPMIDQTAQTNTPRSIIARISGQVWIVAAQPLPLPDRIQLIVGRRLTNDILNERGQKFGLNHLSWTTDANSIEEAARGSSRLLADSGRPLGWLTWTPDSPGHKRILSMLPWIAVGMLAILVLAARVLNIWSEALSRLRRRDEQLNAILSHAADGILITNQAGRIEAANLSSAKLFGRSCSDLVGQKLHDLLRNPGDPDHAVSPIALQPLSHGAAIPIELEAIAPDNSGRAVEVAVGRIQIDDDGGFTNAVSVRDISAQKEFAHKLAQARDAAEAASRAKSEFLASMSHELRTPLNAIIGFSELIAEETAARDPLSKHIEYLQDISGSGRHLLSLIEDVLEYAKYETGRMVLSESPCNLGALLADCLNGVRAEAAARGLQLQQYGLAPGMILVDARKLKAAVGNILSNAVKFTPQGSVTLTVEDRGQGGLAIAVRDTGIGIDPEMQTRVIDPFFQTDMRLSRRYEGIGLGLPLAKAVLDLHGGRLELQSTPGEGTIVTLILPRERLMSLAAAGSARTA